MPVEVDISRDNSAEILIGDCTDHLEIVNNIHENRLRFLNDEEHSRAE